MKICFIGACGHSAQAYRTLQQKKDAQICGFAPGSIHEHNASPFGPEIPFFPSYPEMLDQVKPDLAVVSPVFGLTGRVILECARRGIDVFSEKPIAASLEELGAVEKAVEHAGIRFCAMHYLRYAPAFYWGAERVRRGEIGEVKLITAQKSYRFGERPSWYHDRTLYGGTIPWVGIHAIDWIAHFSGKKFLAVSAQSLGGSPEMAALCQFEMEGGVMACVSIDYYRPETAPSHGDDRIRCVGTQGVLEVRDNQIFLMNNQGCQILAPKEAPDLFEEFYQGKTPIPPEEIFALTRAALAARDAADSGKKIQI